MILAYELEKKRNSRVKEDTFDIKYVYYLKVFIEETFVVLL